MEIDEETLEQLARMIHENYLADHAKNGPSWDDLTEDGREANRAQARDIATKLATIGASIQPGPGPTSFAFTQPELDRLAEDEHRRWVDQRLRSGWTYDVVRNDATKRHPMLVPWDRLPETERIKDRNAIRHIPDVLAGVGLHVVRG
jgi:hypothetical protein